MPELKPEGKWAELSPERQAEIEVRFVEQVKKDYKCTKEDLERILQRPK